MAKHVGKFHKNKVYSADFGYSESFYNKEFAEKKKHKLENKKIRELRNLKKKDFTENSSGWGSGDE